MDEKANGRRLLSHLPGGARGFSLVVDVYPSDFYSASAQNKYDELACDSIGVPAAAEPERACQTRFPPSDELDYLYKSFPLLIS